MNARYQPLYKQAMNLQYKFRDIVDDPRHPGAQSMQREIRELVEDVESEKAPRAIENRIKSIQQALQQTKSQDGIGVLSYEDNNLLYRAFEQMRADLHRLPNY